jgi:hypothetical protein
MAACTGRSRSARRRSSGRSPYRTVRARTRGSWRSVGRAGASRRGGATCSRRMGSPCWQRRTSGSSRCPRRCARSQSRPSRPPGEWLRQRPGVRSGRAGLVGGSKGAELALLAATAYPDLFGPVAAIAPSCVAWFGVDLTGDVIDASARSSWTRGGRSVPFVPPVPGIGFERTERGLRSVGIYAAALEQAEAVAAAAIPVERAAGRCFCCRAAKMRRVRRRRWHGSLSSE